MEPVPSSTGTQAPPLGAALPNLSKDQEQVPLTNSAPTHNIPPPLDDSCQQDQPGPNSGSGPQATLPFCSHRHPGCGSLAAGREALLYKAVPASSPWPGRWCRSPGPSQAHPALLPPQAPQTAGHLRSTRDTWEHSGLMPHVGRPRHKAKDRTSPEEATASDLQTPNSSNSCLFTCLRPPSAEAPWHSTLVNIYGVSSRKMREHKSLLTQFSRLLAQLRHRRKIPRRSRFGRA